jgi:hypothetical protein
LQREVEVSSLYFPAEGKIQTGRGGDREAHLRKKGIE